jgi:hypothetical protein
LTENDEQIDDGRKVGKGGRGGRVQTLSPQRDYEIEELHYPTLNNNNVKPTMS